GGASHRPGDGGGPGRLVPSRGGVPVGGRDADDWAEVCAHPFAKLSGRTGLLSRDTLTLLFTLGIDRGGLDGSHRPLECHLPTHILDTTALHCLWPCPVAQGAPGDRHALAQCLPDPGLASLHPCRFSQVCFCHLAALCHAVINRIRSDQN